MNVCAGWATRGRWSRLSWAAEAFRSSGQGHAHPPRPSLPRPCLPSRHHSPTHQFLPPSPASSHHLRFPPRPCIYSKAVKANQGIKNKATITGPAPGSFYKNPVHPRSSTSPLHLRTQRPPLRSASAPPSSFSGFLIGGFGFIHCTNTLPACLLPHRPVSRLLVVLHASAYTYITFSRPIPNRGPCVLCFQLSESDGVLARRRTRTGPDGRRSGKAKACAGRLMISAAVAHYRTRVNQERLCQVHHRHRYCLPLFSSSLLAPSFRSYAYY
jgi:hypothetical protein